MSIRKIRLEQTIQNEISQMLLKELRDPRIGFCTITQVRLSQDYKFASVYVSFLGGPNAIEDGMKGLQSASKHIQAMLARKLNIKFTPYLRFIYDDSLVKGVAMVEKLNELEAEEEASSSDQSSSSQDQENEKDAFAGS